MKYVSSVNWWAAESKRNRDMSLSVCVCLCVLRREICVVMYYVFAFSMWQRQVDHLDELWMEGLFLCELMDLLLSSQAWCDELHFSIRHLHRIHIVMILSAYMIVVVRASSLLAVTYDHVMKVYFFLCGDAPLLPSMPLMLLPTTTGGGTTTALFL